MSSPAARRSRSSLVKRVLLSAERTATRKIKEAILAAEITRRYSKEDILELYLNEVYYGNLAYGIDAAAETYFRQGGRRPDAGRGGAAGRAAAASRLLRPLHAPRPRPEPPGVVLGLMVRQATSPRRRRTRPGRSRWPMRRCVRSQFAAFHALRAPAVGAAFWDPRRSTNPATASPRRSTRALQAEAERIVAEQVGGWPTATSPTARWWRCARRPAKSSRSWAAPTSTTWRSTAR
jgi:hypothetical protein